MKEMALEKLEERIEEIEKNLSKANNKITELIFNSNKFLICIISCEKNREHKEWIKKTWLNHSKMIKILIICSFMVIQIWKMNMKLMMMNYI